MNSPISEQGICGTGTGNLWRRSRESLEVNRERAGLDQSISDGDPLVLIGSESLDQEREQGRVHRARRHRWAEAINLAKGRFCASGSLHRYGTERRALGEIGHRLGRKVLADVATIARPDTILGWYRKLVARKFDGSKARRRSGRPRIKQEVEQLIVRMASENPGWGYDRIAGALANLGYEISDQTVGNVLRRHGLPPAPERKRTTSWTDFIRAHMELLAGTDFFTAEVLTLRGLVTYYVLFFIHLESRRVYVAGLTVHPTEAWMKQMARNATMDDCGALRDCRYLLHDRDTKYTVIPSYHCLWPGRTARAAGAQSEPERLCGALGPVGQGGVLVQGDPVRRALVAADTVQLCRPLPCRAKSPGEGQRPAVP